MCFTGLLRLPNLPEEAQESIKINKNNFCQDVIEGTVEPGYNEIGLRYISPIPSDIL